MKQKKFKLVSNFSPSGDQPDAIKKICNGLADKADSQVLLGVTGSGKTFTMAHIIKKSQRPALIIAPNKTLAAQLFAEFKDLFPHNKVEYFVSYYDYYQPEAYIPQSDTYIEKDSSINDIIDKMRHSATRSLLTEEDVIIVASVSCIYGLGSPDEYKNMHLLLQINDDCGMDDIKKRLVFMQYERNDYSFFRGTFRVRGDIIDIFPVNEEFKAVRVEFFGDTIDEISIIDPLRGTVLETIFEYAIFPGSHFVTSRDNQQRAMGKIKEELKSRLIELHDENRLVEEQRLEQRTNFDLEMIEELGYCNGIENYSRHFTGRPPGYPPPTLLDYFPEDFIVFLDESHIAVPQLNGMYNGDRARKKTLVNFGFRLPSALDNRPLRFGEFNERINQVVYVSATPGEYELTHSSGRIVEQLIRPTGLLDPVIEVRPATSQVDDLLEEIRLREERNEAVLVTTLTKKMSEDLTEYYKNLGVRVRYLHSDIKTLQRIELINDLRNREYDVLIGINLLREGLDIPEVSLIAILDADKEGFLRSERSLTQTCGRAARNANGKVIMYGDIITGSMQRTIDETKRRRKVQVQYNIDNNIIPETIVSKVKPVIYQHLEEGSCENNDIYLHSAEDEVVYNNLEDVHREIAKCEVEMLKLAEKLEFEQAAKMRDRINLLKKIDLDL